MSVYINSHTIENYTGNIAHLFFNGEWQARNSIDISEFSSFNLGHIYYREFSLDDGAEYKYALYKDSNKLKIKSAVKPAGLSNFIKIDFLESIYDDNINDIELPQEFYTNGQNNKVTIEWNDRNYQKQFWSTGTPDLSYKITNDIKIKYKDNISFARSLGLTDESGWEFDMGEEGEFLYYIDFENKDEIDKNYILKEDGPIFEISKEITLDLIQAKKPSFKFSEVPEIKFKKASQHIENQGFTSSKFEMKTIDPSTIDTSQQTQKDFPYSEWFEVEEYSLANIQSQAQYENQEDYPAFFNLKPKRDEIIDFERDLDLNLYPINTTYKRGDGEQDCNYNKQLYLLPESKDALTDWDNSGRKLDAYFTLNNFLYNVIELINKFKDQEIISGSEFDSFMISKTGNSNYLKAKNISDSFKNFYSPYILYSDNCNIIQRKFYYFGSAYIFVEWSLHHKNTLEEGKVFDPAYRRIYFFDEYFTYEGRNFSKVEYFPFEDFGMQPVSRTV